MQELSEFVLPTLHQLIELLDIAVREMSTCPYMHSIFWNLESEELDSDQLTNIPHMIRHVSGAIEERCAEELETTEGNI